MSKTYEQIMEHAEAMLFELNADRVTVEVAIPREADTINIDLRLERYRKEPEGKAEP